MSHTSGNGNASDGVDYGQLYSELEEEQQQEDNHEATEDGITPERIGTLFDQLERYTVDGPSRKQTQTVLALAAAYANQPQRTAAVPSAARTARPNDDAAGRPLHTPASLPVWLMQHMAIQARTMHRLFWLVSALMAGIGASIEGMAVRKGFLSPAIPDVFLVTVLLLTVASVAYSLRSMHTPMSELEGTFPVTPTQLMVGRIGAILFYDLCLTLLFYGMLVFMGLSGHYGGSVAIRIIDLLLPICLSTFAALAAMLRFGTWPGTVIVLAIGVLQFVAGDRLGVFQLFGAYGSAHWLASKLIAVALAIALAICTYLLLRHRHYYKHQEQEG